MEHREFQGSKNTVYGIIMVTFIQIDRMYNTKNEAQFKLCTLDNYGVLMQVH